MMRRIVMLASVALLVAVLFYLSRFWFLALWPRAGLFGIEALRPQGGLLAVWLRGTVAAPFELLVWAVGSFAVLTFGQKLHDRMTSPDQTQDPDP
ncbi:hypothetical protein ROLI_016590 [Roseobacter fucihabitans]|uniref:Uncharacterized protein n=1 Tax=Roseobacter fucihabitans TaxID=1537242 RepID=A0ABZ2BT40_9RHOB|nr:hypothetical protein [Roseobacter litoralis]MBC6964466.1 hypothetical protein [Roseobacter litoralis]